MSQNQAQAKKKRDEAAQHPGSEMKRILLCGAKASEVQADGESNAQCRDKDSPPQESFGGFRFRLGQPLFCERECFSIVDIAHKTQKTKNDKEYTYDANAWNKVIHFSSQPQTWSGSIVSAPPRFSPSREDA